MNCNKLGSSRLKVCKKISVFFILLFIALPLCAQSNAPNWPIIAGTASGLYGIDWAGKVELLMPDGQVKKIFKSGADWIALGSEGVLVSSNLRDWEKRNSGLPVKVIKVFNDGKKSFLSLVQEIKDLKANPANSDIMVCATKDQVFITRNQGRSWQSLGMPPYRTNGIKSVAVADMPDSRGNSVTTVFVSHSVYGIHYIYAVDNAKWTEIPKGMEKLESTNNPDEVSDITITLNANNSPEIYASQTFRRRIYRLDWARKEFIRLYHDELPFGTIDSLDPGSTGLRFIREGEIAQIDYAPNAESTVRLRPDLLQSIRNIQTSLKIRPDCVLMRENRQANAELVTLSELWLLSETAPSAASKPNLPSTKYAATAWGKEGLYLPVNHAATDADLKRYFDIIDSRGLNMIVIDMKDDYGRLRFTPKNPAVSAMGRVFSPIDLEGFLAKMKERGIFTVARIVVFKDPVVAARTNSKYAVWDSANNKPWVGYNDVKRKKPESGEASEKSALVEILPAADPEYEIVRTYYDEKWVDPYSEEVWDYIAAVSVELAERGFDEIQFDYIRFPTDGENLYQARYRWRDSGMDMESAILSFLRHVRPRINVPISIDIYGANGWYRTGARTGQEVELLAPWVDIICPMYYPNHFEQHFMAQAPEELRPYRIYYTGTLRTARIGRGQVIVRPWAQAFYLNVSYDRKYYDGPLGKAVDYVRRQMEGVRNTGNPGFTFWNNSGRYNDIPLKEAR